MFGLPKNVVPLLSFGKNFFADVRAGDGMIGEIIIEKKGTIVFFTQLGIVQDLPKDFQRTGVIFPSCPEIEAAFDFLKYRSSHNKRLISNVFSWRALSSIASLSGRETIWRSEWSCFETVSRKCEQKKLDLNWIWTKPKLIWPHRQIWPNQTSRCGGWKCVRKRL